MCWHLVGYGLHQYCNISLSWYILLHIGHTSHKVEPHVLMGVEWES